MYGKDNLRELTGKERLGQERQSEYLGAEDIDPGTEPILTIKGIFNGTVTLQRGKENKDVLMFAETTVPGIKHVRPLIVNSTNRKSLRKVYGAVDADTLRGKPIQLYIDHNVRDPETGGKTDGIRVRERKPRPQVAVQAVACADCKKPIVPPQGRTLEWMVQYTRTNYGVPLCGECARKRKSAAEDKKEEVTE